MRRPTAPSAALHPTRRVRGGWAEGVRSLVALLLGLVFLGAWGQPAGVHPCPRHDGAAVVAALAAGHADASSAPHAAHGGHQVARPAADPAMPASDEGGHACQCLGAGCCPATVAVPTAQAVRWHVVVTRRAEPPAPEAARHRRPAARRLLPFANGPPTPA